MNEERLHHWQNVFSRDKAAQSEERELFVHREALYRGLSYLYRTLFAIPIRKGWIRD